MDRDAVAEMGITCLAHYIAGNMEAAAESMSTLAKAAPGGQELLCAAAGWAAIIAEVTAQQSGCALAAEFAALSGAPPTPDEMSALAAFIAAVGNEDMGGATILWDSLGQDGAAELAMNVLAVAGLVAPLWRSPGGEGASNA